MIQGLRALTRPCEVTVTTDSRYVIDGFEKGWLRNWKANGWKTSAKQPVKNRELWEALDAEISRHEVTWVWVKGHASHPYNERCDELAVAECSRASHSA